MGEYESSREEIQLSRNRLKEWVAEDVAPYVNSTDQAFDTTLVGDGAPTSRNTHTLTPFPSHTSDKIGKQTLKLNANRSGGVANLLFGKSRAGDSCRHVGDTGDTEHANTYLCRKYDLGNR